jgi:hypothetical protein
LYAYRARRCSNCAWNTNQRFIICAQTKRTQDKHEGRKEGRKERRKPTADDYLLWNLEIEYNYSNI